MERDETNKSVVRKVEAESRNQAAKVPSLTAAATWTVSKPTETVNVTDAMERNQIHMSESNQKPEVKRESVEEVKINPDVVKGAGVVTPAGPVIGPGMVQVSTQPGATNIPTHGAGAMGPHWSGLSTVQVPPMAHVDNPACQPPVPQYSTDLTIPNLDQPLVIDLSADRFNRTASKGSHRVYSQ